MQDWLYKQAIWQIHAPAPKYIPRCFFDITSPNHTHQADILYLPHHRFKGRLYKYCLTIVDVASRYKYAIPLTSKSSRHVARAFKKAYNSRKNPLIWPKVLQVDGGSEFKGETAELFSEYNTHIRIGHSHHSQGIVERFNRTLADKLFRNQDALEFLIDEPSTEWVNNLSVVLYEINNTITRLLGIPPAEAIKLDEVFALPSKLPKDRIIGYDEVVLPAGTCVRYLIDASELDGGRRRSTDPIWSKEIFTFESAIIRSRQPVMYQLDGGPKRYFVREELMVVPPDTELPPMSLLIK